MLCNIRMRTVNQLANVSGRTIYEAAISRSVFGSSCGANGEAYAVISRSFQKKASNSVPSKDAANDKGRAQDKKLGEAINRFIETAEQAKLQQPKYSAEKQAQNEAIAKEYTRQNMIRTNKFNKDLSTKIWLSQEAMRSLPANLRNAAEVIDEMPPPPDRPWAVFDTPPIPGFNARSYMSGGKGKDEKP